MIDDDDDDFQIPLTQAPKISTSTSRKPKVPLKLSNSDASHRPFKKPKPGKENIDPNEENCSLESILSSIDCDYSNSSSSHQLGDEKGALKINEGYLRNSVESRLLKRSNEQPEDDTEELDVLLKLCEQADVVDSVQCPLCGIDISDLSDELRQVHTNNCLDESENVAHDVSSVSSLLDVK